MSTLTDEHRDLVQQAIERARCHLDFAEAALAADAKAVPAHDKAWKQLASASRTVQNAADLVASVTIEPKESA